MLGRGEDLKTGRCVLQLQICTKKYNSVIVWTVIGKILGKMLEAMQIISLTYSK